LTPLFSIIIPAHNEELRLKSSLQKIHSFIETQPYEIEVYVVENGSTDRTAEIAVDFAHTHPAFHLIEVPQAGKGRAVRHGILAARGEYRFICDTDLSMPIEELVHFLPEECGPYDIAIASREVPGSRRFGEPLYRHLIGRAFNLLVRLLAVPSIHDTQCGFKSFNASVVDELFNLQMLDGWTFDVEVLFIALKRGYRVIEVPINWYYFPGSKIHVLRDSWNMFIDLFRIRRNWRAGNYAPRE